MYTLSLTPQKAMAKTTTIAYTLLLVFVTTTAQPPAPGWMMPPDNSSSLAPSPGGSDCFTALLGTSDCLTYIKPNSNLTVPDPGCCPQISNLATTQPVCLCTLISKPHAAGLTVDKNRTLTLPAACNVTSPPLSLCADVADDGLLAAGPFPVDNASSASLASNQHLLFALPSLLFASLF